MKEVVCYVFLDFKGDFDKMWKGMWGEWWKDYVIGGGIVKDYVFFDFYMWFYGIVWDYELGVVVWVRKSVVFIEDILIFWNECFFVFELLFNLIDIGFW